MAKRKNSGPPARLTKAARATLEEELALYEAQDLQLGLQTNALVNKAQQNAEHAMDVVLEIMNDPKTKKTLRFRAAQEIMQRGMGRPGPAIPPKDPSQMSDEEIEMRAAAILKKRQKLLEAKNNEGVDDERVSESD